MASIVPSLLHCWDGVPFLFPAEFWLFTKIGWHAIIFYKKKTKKTLNFHFFEFPYFRVLLACSADWTIGLFPLDFELNALWRWESLSQAVMTVYTNAFNLTCPYLQYLYIPGNLNALAAGRSLLNSHGCFLLTSTNSVYLTLNTCLSTPR